MVLWMDTTLRLCAKNLGSLLRDLYILEIFSLIIMVSEYDTKKFEEIHKFQWVRFEREIRMGRMSMYNCFTQLSFVQESLATSHHVSCSEVAKLQPVAARENTKVIRHFPSRFLLKSFTYDILKIYLRNKYRIVFINILYGYSVGINLP